MQGIVKMEDEVVMKWVITTVITAGVAFGIKIYIMLSTLLQRSNPDVMKEQVAATEELTRSIDKLAHYTKWRIKDETGKEPEPFTGS